MDQILPFPQTELWLRTTVVLDELDRLHESWLDGRTPTAAEIANVADDLAALRESVEFAGVIAAFEAPAVTPAY
ncbi:hypothetical protein [Patulibacter minatonensis]|uniref:hypothetical protein n=1 Tax=Patulibacter minatonensis TaxID=298163 RepID=UPI00047C9288|nr:hypothetical protein [Patulibacter minatonensis]